MPRHFPVLEPYPFWNKVKVKIETVKKMGNLKLEKLIRRTQRVDIDKRVDINS